MRIVPKVCEKCGATYRYKVSGSTSPSDWNKAQGVTWKYCSSCSTKTFIKPEFRCPPVQRLRGRIKTIIHNWLYKHTKWYGRWWRGGREPDRMIDMGPVTVKPLPKVDLSSIYMMEFDVDKKEVE